MIPPFFITGLPRTRSAWLAAWLTTDNSICWHDRPFDESLLEHNRLVGFSGAELVSQYSLIAETYPNAQWLVVKRDTTEAMESFKAWAGDRIPAEFDLEWFFHRREVDLAAISSKPRTLTVEFASLGDRETCRQIWYHLLRMAVSVPFDSDRWVLFNDLNIQQDIRNHSYLFGVRVGTKKDLCHSPQLQP